MNNRKKSIKLVLVAIAVISIFALVEKKKENSYKEKIEKSIEIMEKESIEATEKEEAVVSEVSKESSVEYSYVTHFEDTVILKIKFKDGMSEKKIDEILEQYTKTLAKEYPDKNINTTIVSE